MWYRDKTWTGKIKKGHVLCTSELHYVQICDSWYSALEIVTFLRNLKCLNTLSTSLSIIFSPISDLRDSIGEQWSFPPTVWWDIFSLTFRTCLNLWALSLFYFLREITFLSEITNYFTAYCENQIRQQMWKFFKKFRMSKNCKVIWCTVTIITTGVC